MFLPLNLLIHPLDDIDVDFYWLDSNFDSKLELWAINHYHFLDMRRNYKIRPMLLTSNSLIAEHRYPVLYAGSNEVAWDTLKKIPSFICLSCKFHGMYKK